MVILDINSTGLSLNQTYFQIGYSTQLTVTQSRQTHNNIRLALQNLGQTGVRALATGVNDTLSSLDQQSHKLEG
jgi:uncharacterized membrane protein